MASRDGRLPQTPRKTCWWTIRTFRATSSNALQTILEEEMSAQLGADRYERTGERRGYRNGNTPRSLTSRVGTLDLLVPCVRDGSFSTELFARYQRTEQALVLGLLEMDIQGVSTRKVVQNHRSLVWDALLREPGLDRGETAGHRVGGLAGAATLGAELPLLLCRCALRACAGGGQVRSQGVLIASGLRGDDGHREILGVMVADSERAATWQELFRSLKAWGLSGVRLVISDDHTGLRLAIRRHFQGVSWQCCQSLS